MGLQEPEVELRPSAYRLQGKVAIVTGSTSGIGKATAVLFAHEGGKVVVVGRRAEKGQAVVDFIKGSGGEAIFVQTDVTIEEQLQNLVKTTIDTYGTVDILVNNAGTLIQKPICELTRKDWDKFVELDAYSYFRCMQLVLPIMEKQGSGNIVNVTSLAAIDPLPFSSIYGFVKAGVTHMTKVIAKEYVDKGIRVNALLPGVVNTEMISDNPNTDAMCEMIPMGRPSVPVEQAYTILFMASEESSYMTGCSIVSDGGVRGI